LLDLLVVRWDVKMGSRCTWIPAEFSSQTCRKLALFAANKAGRSEIYIPSSHPLIVGTRSWRILEVPRSPSVYEAIVDAQGCHRPSRAAKDKQSRECFGHLHILVQILADLNDRIVRAGQLLVCGWGTATPYP
jgi:hypothetical protein